MAKETTETQRHRELPAGFKATLMTFFIFKKFSVTLCLCG